MCVPFNNTQMKLKFILFLLVLCGFANEAVSQVRQNCNVMEYRGEKAKKPLPNVTVVVSGAGSNVSDKNGYLCLTFRDQAPGSKVIVRKIELDGYEVFNKDAVDNWRISDDNESFNIVLCKSSSFKAMKDKYYSVSSDSYAAQLKKETNKMKELLEAGKIKESEYNKSVQEIRNHFDEQLENLDNYIDRFARIDLANITGEERKIVQMVQDGNIDGAIKAYDNLKIMDKILNLTNQIATIDVSIGKLEKKKNEDITRQNELYSSLNNMINLLMLQGGRENMNKIMNLHEQAAVAMPDNDAVVLDCALFYKEQNHLHKSLEWLVKYLEFRSITDSHRAFAENSCSEVCMELGMVDESWVHNKKSQSILESIKEKSEWDTINLIRAKGQQALLSQTTRQYENAIEYWTKLIPLCDSAYVALNNKELIAQAKFRVNCNLLELMIVYGQPEKSLKLGEEMLAYAKSHFNPNRIQSKCELAMAYNQYGYALSSSGQCDKAIECMLKALDLYLSVYEKIPDSIASDLALTYNRLTLTYFTIGEYDKAMEYSMSDLKFKEEASVIGGDYALYDYALALNNVGYLAYLNKQYDVSGDYYEKALRIDEELTQKYPDVYLMETNRARINKMTLMLAQKSYNECKDLNAKCLEEAEYLYTRYKEIYLDNYLLTYFNHGEYCVAVGDIDGARKAVDLILGFNPDYFKQRNDSLLSTIIR